MTQDTSMPHRMQWADDRLIEQIVDGRKTATVRHLSDSAELDDYNTALDVGAIYQIYDGERQVRATVRLTAVALVRWGDLPEDLWRRDPAATGEVSEAAFRSDHFDYFGRPSDDYEFLAVYFDQVPMVDATG